MALLSLDPKRAGILALRALWSPRCVANGPEDKPQPMLVIVIAIKPLVALESKLDAMLGPRKKVVLKMASRIARRLPLISAPMLPARKTSPVS